MDDLIEKVRLNGIEKKENWLSLSDQEKIKNIISLINASKGDSKSWFVVKFKLFLIKFLKFQFKSIIRSLFFIGLSKKLKLKNIAEKILENKAELIGIDCYCNPRSEKPVLDWHLDNAYSGRADVKNFVDPDKNAIKFFFYLTDVSMDNGCLSYIPKSNKIAHALKKGIYEKAINYSPYWTLSDFRKTILIKKNFEYVKNIVGEDLILEFLKMTSFVENKNLNTNAFDFEVNKGGAVIFDEAGVHRGSKTKFNERLALRFLYRKI